MSFRFTAPVSLSGTGAATSDDSDAKNSLLDRNPETPGCLTGVPNDFQTEIPS